MNMIEKKWYKVRGIWIYVSGVIVINGSTLLTWLLTAGVNHPTRLITQLIKDSRLYNKFNQINTNITKCKILHDPKT